VAPKQGRGREAGCRGRCPLRRGVPGRSDEGGHPLGREGEVGHHNSQRSQGVGHGVGQGGGGLDQAERPPASWRANG
jgi:hypothetical protein